MKKAEAKAAATCTKQNKKEKSKKKVITERNSSLKTRGLLDSRQIDLDSQKEMIQGKITEIKEIKNQLDGRKEEIDKN